MAELTKDSPLVVAKILMEMYGLNAHTDKLELALNRMAELVLLRQLEITKRFNLLMKANRINTTMLINAFRDEVAVTCARLSGIRNRLERLENN